MVIFLLLFQPTFGAISFILSPFLKLSHAFGAIFLVLKYILLFKPAFYFFPSLPYFFAFRSHYGATLY